MAGAMVMVRTTATAAMSALEMIFMELTTNNLAKLAYFINFVKGF